MNIDELRAAFNLSETVVEHIRNFRRNRAEVIKEDQHEEVPVLLRSGVRLVVQAIPFSFNEPNTFVDLSIFNSHPLAAEWVRKASLHTGRYNLNGYMLTIGSQNDAAGYLQVFRNGVIEGVKVGYQTFTTTKETTQRLSLTALEDTILEFISKALFIQNNLNIQVPLVIMVSLLNAKDHILVAGNRLSEDLDWEERFTAGQNTILFPDIVFELYEHDPKVVMKPIFEMLWNMGGWGGSQSYDENGNWKQNRGRR